MVYNETDDSTQISSAAVGGIAFGGSMMIMIGAFSTTAGLAGIIDDGYFNPVRRYAFDIPLSAWGWIHLVLGIALVVAGFGLFVGKAWARIAAMILTGLCALNFFLFIPYAPFWSVVVIALCAWVMWSLSQSKTHGTEQQPL